LTQRVHPSTTLPQKHVRGVAGHAFTHEITPRVRIAQGFTEEGNNRLEEEAKLTATWQDVPT
jgi:hypothetical protein